MKVKGVDISKLKPNQQKAMKSHSIHHTAKHIRSMLKMMLKGKSFSKSHIETQKIIGK